MRTFRGIIWQWRAAAAVLCFSLGWAACPAVQGAGVAAVKDQPFHSDDLASIIAYASINEGSATVLFDLGTREMSLDRTKVAGYVTVPELPANIRDEAATAQLRTSLEKLSAFAGRYKKAVSVLQPYIDQLKTSLDRLAQGDVRYEARWISSTEHAAILRKEMEARAAARLEDEQRQQKVQVAREAERAFIAEQRGKGLERYKDKWLPRQEVELLREAIDKVTAKSVSQMVYTVLQVVPNGVLIKPRSGMIRQGGLNTDFVFLYGVPKSTAAVGDFYRDDVYWCGTYSFVTRFNRVETLHAYCFNKDEAVERVKAALAPDPEPDSRRGLPPGMVGTPPQTQEDDIPPLLRDYDGCGSGFFIGEEGYFVTNAHVVGDAATVDIYYEEKKVPARVLYVSKTADLAVVKADLAVSGLVLAEEEAELGNDIYVVGFPRPTMQGIDVKVTKGIVSSKRVGSDESRFQIDAASQPGNSGGALCDELGRVRGVLVATLDPETVLKRTGSLPQNVNYAIKTSELAAFLRSKSVTFQQSNVTDAQGPRGIGVKMVCAASGLVLVKK